MENPPPTDAKLVDRARGGDVDAYGELVRRYQDRALATAFFILGDRQEAEDATQEAFTRAFGALGRFRPEGSFRPWLLRIVVNEAHDLRAAAQRRANLLARATGQFASIRPAPSAEAAGLIEQRREALLRALFELREEDRLVITYRYFFDFSEAETAEVLGVARGTVKSRLARALARFGPIVRRLGPLVVVGPSVESVLAPLLKELRLAPQLQARPELGSTVLQRLSIGATPGKAPSPLTQPAVITLAALTAVGLVVGALALSPRPQASPPVGTTPQAEIPTRTLAAQAETPNRTLAVYGVDLTDADRQEVAAILGGQDASPSETVSRAELAGTLSAQGLPVAASDQAISSARLTCLGPGSGLTVRTHNISGIPAPGYAGALITAGLADASMIVAAPANKPVTGEAALVGALKAAPVCLRDGGLDPNRMRLAYEQLKATQALAGSAPDLTHASAVVLTALQAVVTGAAQDGPAIEDALKVAAQHEGISIDDGARAQLVSLLQELRGLDFGEYAHGYRIEQLAPDTVRVVPTPRN